MSDRANNEEPKVFRIAVHRQVTFEARKTPVPCVRVQFPDFMIVDGIQFQSVEQIMKFFDGILDKAKELWPDDPYIKMLDE